MMSEILHSEKIDLVTNHKPLWQKWRCVIQRSPCQKHLLPSLEERDWLAASSSELPQGLPHILSCGCALFRTGPSQ